MKGGVYGEEVYNVSSSNILGVESMIFLSAFILTFLFVAEFVPVFFAFLITAHELSHQIERGVLKKTVRSLLKKFYSFIHSFTSLLSTSL